MRAAEGLPQKNAEGAKVRRGGFNGLMKIYKPSRSLMAALTSAI